MPFEPVFDFDPVDPTPTSRPEASPYSLPSLEQVAASVDPTSQIERAAKNTFRVLGRDIDIERLRQMDGGEDLLKIQEAKGQRGFWEAVTDIEASQLPFVGDVIPVKNLLRVRDTFDKLTRGEDVSEQDRIYAALWMAEQERKGNQTWKGMAGDIIKHLPGYMAEFATYTGAGIMTGFTSANVDPHGPISEIVGGAVGFGIAGARVGASLTRKLVGKVASEGIEKSFSKFLTKMGTSAYLKSFKKPVTDMITKGVQATIKDVGVNAAFNLAQGNNLLEQTGSVERQIGNILNTGDADANKARMAALGDDLIEYTSEAFGEVFNAALAPVGGKLFGEAGWFTGAKMRERIIKMFGKTAADQKSKAAGLGLLAGSLIDKMGWSVEKAMNFLVNTGYDGPVQEFAEERFGGFLRGLFGLQGDDNNKFKNAFKEMFIDSDQFKAEAVAFSIPLATVSAISATRKYAFGGTPYAKNYDTVQRFLHPAGGVEATDVSEISSTEPLADEKRGVYVDRVDNAATSFAELAQTEAEITDATPTVLSKIGFAALDIIEGLVTFSFGQRARGGIGTTDMLMARQNTHAGISHGAGVYTEVLKQLGTNPTDATEAEKKEALQRTYEFGLDLLSELRGTLAVNQGLVDAARKELGEDPSDEELEEYFKKNENLRRVPIRTKTAGGGFTTYVYMLKDADPGEQLRKQDEIAKRALLKTLSVYGEVNAEEMAENITRSAALRTLSQEVTVPELQDMRDNPLTTTSIPLLLLHAKQSGTMFGSQENIDGFKAYLDKLIQLHSEMANGEVWVQGEDVDDLSAPAVLVTYNADGTASVRSLPGRADEKVFEALKPDAEERTATEGVPLTRVRAEKVQGALESHKYTKSKITPTEIRIVPEVTDFTHKDPVALVKLAEYGDVTAGLDADDAKKAAEDFIRGTLHGGYNEELGVWHFGAGGYHTREGVFVALGPKSEYDTAEEFIEHRLKWNAWAEGKDSYEYTPEIQKFIDAAMAAVGASADIDAADMVALSLMLSRENDTDTIAKIFLYLMQGYRQELKLPAGMRAQRPFAEALNNAYGVLMNLSSGGGVNDITRDFLIEVARQLGMVNYQSAETSDLYSFDANLLARHGYSRLTKEEREQLVSDLNKAAKGEKVEVPEAEKPAPKEKEEKKRTTGKATPPDKEKLVALIRSQSDTIELQGDPSPTARREASRIRTFFNQGMVEVENKLDEKGNVIGHIYKINGVEVPGVTSTIGEDADFKFEAAHDPSFTDQGTQMHDAAEAIIDARGVVKNIKLSEEQLELYGSVDEFISAYAELIQFIQKMVLEGYALIPELVIWDAKHAGRVDLIAVHPTGVIRLFDYKTMGGTSNYHDVEYLDKRFDDVLGHATVRERHATQLGAYISILNNAGDGGFEVVSGNIIPVRRMENAKDRPLILNPETKTPYAELLSNDVSDLFLATINQSLRELGFDEFNVPMGIATTEFESKETPEQAQGAEARAKSESQQQAEQSERARKLAEIQAKLEAAKAQAAELEQRGTPQQPESSEIVDLGDGKPPKDKETPPESGEESGGGGLSIRGVLEDNPASVVIYGDFLASFAPSKYNNYLADNFDLDADDPIAEESRVLREFTIDEITKRYHDITRDEVERAYDTYTKSKMGKDPTVRLRASRALFLKTVHDKQGAGEQLTDSEAALLEHYDNSEFYRDGEAMESYEDVHKLRRVLNSPVMELVRTLIGPEVNKLNAEEWFSSQLKADGVLPAFDPKKSEDEKPDADYPLYSPASFKSWLNADPPAKFSDEQKSDLRLLKALAGALGFDGFSHAARVGSKMHMTHNATVEQERDSAGVVLNATLNTQFNDFAATVRRDAYNYTVKTLSTSDSTFRARMARMARQVSDAFDSAPGKKDTSVLAQLGRYDREKPAYFGIALGLAATPREQIKPENLTAFDNTFASLAADAKNIETYYGALVADLFSFLRELTGHPYEWRQIERIVKNSGDHQVHQWLLQFGRNSVSWFAEALGNISEAEGELAESVAGAGIRMVSAITGAASNLFYTKDKRSKKQNVSSDAASKQALVTSDGEVLSATDGGHVVPYIMGWLNAMSRHNMATSVMKPMGERYPGWALEDWIIDAVLRDPRFDRGMHKGTNVPVIGRIAGLRTYRISDQHRAMQRKRKGTTDIMAVNDDKVKEEQIMDIMRSLFNLNPESEYVTYIPILGDKVNLYYVNVPREAIKGATDFDVAYQYMHDYATSIYAGAYDWKMLDWVKRSRLLTTGGVAPLLGVEGGLGNTMRVLVLKDGDGFEFFNGHGYASRAFREKIIKSYGRDMEVFKGHITGLDYDNMPVIIKTLFNLAIEENEEEGSVEGIIQKFMEKHNIDYVVDSGGAKMLGIKQGAELETYSIEDLKTTDAVTGWMLDVPTRLIRETGHLDHEAIPERRRMPKPLRYDNRNLPNGGGEALNKLEHEYIQWAMQMIQAAGFPPESDLMSRADSLARILLERGVSPDMVSMLDKVKTYRMAYINSYITPPGYGIYAYVKASGGEYKPGEGTKWFGGIEDPMLLDIEKREDGAILPMGARVNIRTPYMRQGYFVDLAYRARAEGVTEEQYVGRLVEKAYAGDKAAEKILLNGLVDSKNQVATLGHRKLPLRDLINRDGSFDDTAIRYINGRLYLMGSWVLINRTPGGGMHAHAMARITDPANWVKIKMTNGEVRWISGKSNAVKMHPEAVYRAGVDWDGDMAFIPTYQLDDNYREPVDEYPAIDEAVSGLDMSNENDRKEFERLMDAGAIYFHNQYMTALREAYAKTPLSRHKEHIDHARFAKIQVPKEDGSSELVDLDLVDADIKKKYLRDLGNVAIAERMFKSARGSTLGRERIVAQHRDFEFIIRSGLISFTKDLQISDGLDLSSDKPTDDQYNVAHELFQDGVNLIIDDVANPRAVALGLDTDAVPIFAMVLMHQHLNTKEEANEFLSKWAVFSRNSAQMRGYRAHLIAMAKGNFKESLEDHINKFVSPEDAKDANFKERVADFVSLVKMSRNLVTARYDILPHLNLPKTQQEHLAKNQARASADTWTLYLKTEKYLLSSPESKTANMLHGMMDSMVFGTKASPDPAADILVKLAIPKILKIRGERGQTQLSWNMLLNLISHTRHMHALDSVVSVLPQDVMDLLEEVIGQRELDAWATNMDRGLSAQTEKPAVSFAKFMEQLAGMDIPGESKSAAERELVDMPAELSPEDASLETADAQNTQAEDEKAEDKAEDADLPFVFSRNQTSVPTTIGRLRKATRIVISEALNRIYEQGTTNPFLSYITARTSYRTGASKDKKTKSKLRQVTKIETLLRSNQLNDELLALIHEGIRALPKEFDNGTFPVRDLHNIAGNELPFDSNLLPYVFLLNSVLERDAHADLSISKGGYFALMPAEFLNAVAEAGRTMLNGKKAENEGEQDIPPHPAWGGLINHPSPKMRDRILRRLVWERKKAAGVNNRLADRMKRGEVDYVRPLTDPGMYGVAKLNDPVRSFRNEVDPTVTTVKEINEEGLGEEPAAETPKPKKKELTPNKPKKKVRRARQIPEKFEHTTVIDFETYYDKELFTLTGSNVFNYVADPRFNPYLVAIKTDGGKTWVGNPRNFDWSKISNHLIVMQNASFDSLVIQRLKAEGVIPEDVVVENIADTQTMFKRAYPEEGHSNLGAIAAKELDPDIAAKVSADKEEVRNELMEGLVFELAPREERRAVMRYAKQDAEVTWDVFQSMLKKFGDNVWSTDIMIEDEARRVGEWRKIITSNAGAAVAALDVVLGFEKAYSKLEPGLDQKMAEQNFKTDLRTYLSPDVKQYLHYVTGADLLPMPHGVKAQRISPRVKGENPANLTTFDGSLVQIKNRINTARLTGGFSIRAAVALSATLALAGASARATEAEEASRVVGFNYSDPAQDPALLTIIASRLEEFEGINLSKYDDKGGADSGYVAVGPGYRLFHELKTEFEEATGASFDDVRAGRVSLTQREYLALLKLSSVKAVRTAQDFDDNYNKLTPKAQMYLADLAHWNVLQTFPKAAAAALKAGNYIKFAAELKNSKLYNAVKADGTPHLNMRRRIREAETYFRRFMNGQSLPSEITEEEIDQTMAEMSKEYDGVEHEAEKLDPEKPMNDALGGQGFSIRGGVVNRAKTIGGGLNMLAYLQAKRKFRHVPKATERAVRTQEGIRTARNAWRPYERAMEEATNADDFIRAVRALRNKSMTSDMTYKFGTDEVDTMVSLYDKIQPMKTVTFMQHRGTPSFYEAAIAYIDELDYADRVQLPQEAALPPRDPGEYKQVEFPVEFLDKNVGPDGGASIRASALSMYSEINPLMRGGNPILFKALLDTFNFANAIESDIQAFVGNMNREWGLFNDDGKIKKAVSKLFPGLTADGRLDRDNKAEMIQYDFSNSGQKLDRQELQLIKILLGTILDMGDYVKDKTLFSDDPKIRERALAEAIKNGRWRAMVSAADFTTLKDMVGEVLAAKVKEVALPILVQFGETEALLDAKTISKETLGKKLMWKKLYDAGVVDYVRRSVKPKPGEPVPVGGSYRVDAPVFTLPASWVIQEFEESGKRDKSSTLPRSKAKLVEAGRSASRLTAEFVLRSVREKLKEVREQINREAPSLLGPYTPLIRLRDSFMPHFFGHLGIVGSAELQHLINVDEMIKRNTAHVTGVIDELSRKAIKGGIPQSLNAASDQLLKWLFSVKELEWTNREDAIALIHSGKYEELGLTPDMQLLDVLEEIDEGMTSAAVQQSLFKAAEMEKELKGIQDPFSVMKTVKNSISMLKRNNIRGRTRISTPRAGAKTYAHMYQKSGLLPRNITPFDGLGAYTKSILTGLRYRNTLNQMIMTKNAYGTHLVIIDPDEEASDYTTIDPKVMREYAKSLALSFGEEYKLNMTPEDNVRAIIKKHVKNNNSYVKHDSPTQDMTAVYAFKTPVEDNVFDMLQGGEISTYVAEVLNATYRDPFRLVKALEDINGLMKTINLMPSLFFAITGIESLVAGTSGKALTQLIGENGSLHEIRQLVKANHPWVQRTRRLAQRNGVMLAETLDPFDMPIGQLNKILKAQYKFFYKHFGKEEADKLKPILGFPAGMTRFMFDTIFNTGKLYMFDHFIQLERKAALDAGVPFSEEYAAAKWAGAVNNAMGGQNPMMYSWLTPKARKIMNLTFFSWNWSLSTWNQAGGGVLTGPLLKNYLAPNEASFIFLKNWPAMFAIIMFGFPQLIQAAAYAFGMAFDEDEDKEKNKLFLWQNEPGKKFHADITPFVRKSPLYRGDPTGNRRFYIRWGKQSYEVVSGWLESPSRTMMSKLSSVARYVLEQATGETVGMGWDLGFKDVGFLGSLFEGEDGEFMSSRAGHTIKAFTPFSILAWARSPDAAPLQLFGPVSKGTSFNRATEAYMGLLESWAREDTYGRLYKHKFAKANLDALGFHILEAAERNGYDPKKVLDSARSAVLRDLYADLYAAIDKQDKQKIEKASNAIARLNGKVQSVVRSTKNRNQLYGKPATLTKEQKEAIVEAFRRP